MAEFMEVMSKARRFCLGPCKDCPAHDITCVACNTFTDEEIETFERVIMQAKEPVDWSTVKVDTPVLVKTQYGNTLKRYFAKYENGKIYTFLKGATSWSANVEEILAWDMEDVSLSYSPTGEVQS